MEQDPSTTWDLSAALAVLRRRRLWIVGAVVIAVAASLALSLTATPVYRSSTEVLIEPDVVQQDVDVSGQSFLFAQELGTQLRVARSEAVIGRVVDRLGLGEPVDTVARKLGVDLVSGTRVLVLSATDTDPDRARELAEAHAEEYLAFRRDEASRRVGTAASLLDARLADTRERIRQLDDQIAAATEGAVVSALLSERENLASDAADLEQQRDSIDSIDVEASGAGRVIVEADLPERPSSPRPVQSTAVALVLGLGLGVVLSFVVDSIDDAVQTVEEVAQLTGLPVVGRVPFATYEDGGSLSTLRAPESPVAEAFRDIRTNLRFLRTRGEVHVLSVVSSMQGEGKSVVAANVAVAAAAAGRSVVIVEADLRRPAIGRLFGLANGLGVSDVISGEARLDEALQQVDDLDLTVLTSGARPPNPSELLGTADFRTMVDRLAARFDLVIVDTPPVLVVPDALEVAGLTDATLLVVELRRAARKELRDAVRRLQLVEAPLAGAVVNRADLDPSQYGYYYYYAAE